MTNKLKVNEIFFSLQGESSYQGLPCVFVRLTGCNLRCQYCDTRHAFFKGTEMTVDEVIEKVSVFTCRLVEITGGEPLLQKETETLASKLLDLGYQVLVETNGTLDISGLDKRVVKVLDIKCPSSKEADKNLLSNIELLSEKDEVKFVIADETDYSFAKDLIDKFDLTSKFKILMSPTDLGDGIRQENTDLPKWILRDGLPVRYQKQLHRQLGIK